MKASLGLALRTLLATEDYAGLRVALRQLAERGLASAAAGVPLLYRVNPRPRRTMERSPLGSSRLARGQEPINELVDPPDCQDVPAPILPTYARMTLKEALPPRTFLPPTPLETLMRRAALLSLPKAKRRKTDT
ncbi:hypothetical protein EV714DRAFT_273730 [Schizophyllum commune]